MTVRTGTAVAEYPYTGGVIPYQRLLCQLCGTVSKHTDTGLLHLLPSVKRYLHPVWHRPYAEANSTFANKHYTSSSEQLSPAAGSIIPGTTLGRHLPPGPGSDTLIANTYH